MVPKQLGEYWKTLSTELASDVEVLRNQILRNIKKMGTIRRIKAIGRTRTNHITWMKRDYV